MSQQKKIITEWGEEFFGSSFGADKDAVLEMVFNTSMTGYQEILSDPSYTDQAVVMTYPLIGNYGTATDDNECDKPSIGALIVHEYNDEPSNFRSLAPLSDMMMKCGIVGVCGVDTRRLTRRIRDIGSCKVLITSADTSLSEGLEILKKSELATDQVGRVSAKSVKTYGEDNARFHVALIDCGVKSNIVRSLLSLGCKVTVMPFDTPTEKVLSIAPDGVLISNGPGDPTSVPQTITAVKALIGRLPIYGICLGHQILSLAYGAETYKLKFGHRGGNHPVKEVATGRIDITSQNHSYAVSKEGLEKTPLAVTHINLLDNTVEGVSCERDKAFGVQFHPEGAPGPHDSKHLFDRFIELMKEVRHA